MTVPTTTVLVDAPVAVVHSGCSRATATVSCERAAGPVDGALRVHEEGRVVPGLTTQLHALGTVGLDLGRLRPGWHTLTAAYTGGSRYGCATSEEFIVLVLPATTVTDVVVPPTGVAPGGCLGVTVRTTDASTYASGTVALFDRARLVATGEVVDGIGTITVPVDLRPGLHRLFAAYAGSETHCPSETPILPVAVRATDFSQPTSREIDR